MPDGRRAGHPAAKPRQRALWARDARAGEWALAAALLLLGAGLAITVPESDEFLFDATLIRAVQRVDGVGGLASFFNGFLNDWGIPAMWAGSVVFYVAARRWDVATYFALAFVVMPATRLLKAAVGRDRPAGSFDVIEFPESASFPSGHTTTAVGFFGSWLILAPFLLPAAWVFPVRCVCVVGIVLTAFFRLWTGAHWPSDVVGGAVFGFGWLVLVLAAFALAGRLQRCGAEGAG